MPFKKAIAGESLSHQLAPAVRFRLAVRAGFEAVEMTSVTDQEEAAKVGDAAREAGLKIHSVRTNAHWRHPLSSADPGDVRMCVDAVRTALTNARLWGADTLLLNAGVVDARTSYSEAYARSQMAIRNEILPMARDFGIIVGIENMMVGGFLVSPLEYVRYVDELESPWVRCYLDVGNMIFGHPQHWIRAAGRRIVKLHLKDFQLDWARGRFAFGLAGDGNIDWVAVRTALLDVGFSGYVTSTSMTRGTMLRGLGRGVRLARRPRLSAVPGWSGVTRSLASAYERSDFLFLQDISRRHDRFLQ